MFLSDKFFLKNYPKSLDNQYFLSCYNKLVKERLSVFDSISTLSKFTALSIIKAIEILPIEPKKIIIVGGGMYNEHIVNLLKYKFDDIVLTAKEVGLNTKLIEAELFALLAVRNLYKLPITFPKTTGVSKPLLGGVLHK